MCILNTKRNRAKTEFKFKRAPLQKKECVKHALQLKSVTRKESV